MSRIFFASALLATALPALAFEPIKGLIGFDVGYSRRMAEPSEVPLPSLEPYVEELRTGWNFGLIAAKFFSEIYGLGAQFNLFRTSNEAEGIVFPIDGTTYVGTSDDMTMWFLGPVLLSQTEFAGGNAVLSGQIGLGYFGYSNASTLGQMDLDITASTLAISTAIRLGHRLSETLLVGIQMRFLGGSFQEVKVNGREAKLDQRESIGRLDFGIFIDFANLKLAKPLGEGRSPGLRPLPQSRPASL